MFDFLFKQYDLGRLTFNQFKSLIVKYNFKEHVMVLYSEADDTYEFYRTAWPLSLEYMENRIDVTDIYVW